MRIQVVPTGFDSVTTLRGVFLRPATNGKRHTIPAAAARFGKTLLCLMKPADDSPLQLVEVSPLSAQRRLSMTSANQTHRLLLQGM